MPTFLYARSAVDAVEEQKIRKWAGAWLSSACLGAASPSKRLTPGAVPAPRTVAANTCDVRPLERSGCHPKETRLMSEGGSQASVQGLSPPQRASRVTAGCGA